MDKQTTFKKTPFRPCRDEEVLVCEVEIKLSGNWRYDPRRPGRLTMDKEVNPNKEEEGSMDG